MLVMPITKLFASLTVFCVIVVAGCLYAWPSKGDHSEVTAAAVALLMENAVVAALACIWGW